MSDASEAARPQPRSRGPAERRRRPPSRAVGLSLLVAVEVCLLQAARGLAPQARTLAKAKKNAILKLRDGEKVVGFNRSFREEALAGPKSQRLREGFSGFRVDFVVHRRGHGKVFPNVAQFFIKESPTQPAFVRAVFDVDLEYLAWGVHRFLVERIRQRYPGRGIEIVLDQSTRKERSAVWRVCRAISTECNMGWEFQRYGKWNVIDPREENVHYLDKAFSPPLGTVTRLSGSVSNEPLSSYRRNLFNPSPSERVEMGQVLRAELQKRGLNSSFDVKNVDIQLLHLYTEFHRHRPHLQSVRS